MGRNGGEEHQTIAKILRTKIIPLLRKRGYPNAAIIYLQKIWDYKLGYKDEDKNKLHPDAMICSRYVPYEYLNGNPYEDEMILIEIGNYTPSKWPFYSVIHIGFNYKVTSIFKSESDFKLQTLKAIEEVLAPGIKDEFDSLSLEDLRLLIQFALIGIGLTSEQFESITIDNLNLDEEIISLEFAGEKLEFNENSSLMIRNYITKRENNGETITKQTTLLEVGKRTLQKDLRKHIESLYS